MMYSVLVEPSRGADKTGTITNARFGQEFGVFGLAGDGCLLQFYMFESFGGVNQRNGFLIRKYSTRIIVVHNDAAVLLQGSEDLAVRSIQ